MWNNRVIKPEGAQHVPYVSWNHFVELAILGLQQDSWLSLMKTSNSVVWYHTGLLFEVATHLLLTVWCLLLTLPVNCKCTFLEGFHYRRYSVQIASVGNISDLGSGGAVAGIMALWFTAVTSHQVFNFSDILIS
jgi:hypothetical protein